MKSLSIVIPVYNGENFIQSCVESIVRQDNGNIEIIIVNDGSTDNTALICKLLSEKYSFVKHFDKENGGVSSARNFALDKISGEHVWFVDADDSIINNAIDEIFKNDSELTIFNFIQLNENNEKSVHLIAKEYCYQVNSLDDFFQNYVFAYKLNNALWNKIFKTSIIKENGLLFDENIKIGEDYLFGLRYYKLIKEICFCATPIYQYFINADGAMKSRNKNVFTYQQAIAKAVKDEYQNLLSPSIMQQFLLMQFVCAIHQSKERSVDKQEIKQYEKEYMKEIMDGERFSHSVVNNFLKSEGAGFLSKIKFKLMNRKIYK